MIKIDFPPPDFQIKNSKTGEKIFDKWRKKWVYLTPEEWVRQNFLQYLAQIKNYPSSLIAVEKEINLNGIKKRFDIVVYKNETPWMMVECKEMQVELSEKTINQIINYNIALPVQYLVITNGNNTFAIYIDEGKFQWLNELPVYNS